MRILLFRCVVLLGLAVVAIAEGLSVQQALNRTSILAAWALVVVGMLVVLVRGRRSRALVPFLSRRIRAFGNALLASPLRFLLVVLLGAFVLGVGVVAWTAPPNTFDSMTYHMSRVSHWIQNSSLVIYPTPISRQYEYPAFSEYSILHLQLATATDQFANLVQYAAYIGAIVGVSTIAKLQGLRADGQLMAGTFAATVPMAVIQASSTQTDLVASLWLTCAVIFSLRYVRSPNLWDLFFVGAGLALAAFTKLPGLIFAVAIGFWFVVLLLRPTPTRRTAITALVVITAVVALVSAPHYKRLASLAYRSLTDTQTTGSVSSSSLRSTLPLRYVNRTILPQAVISNLLRNVALHLGLPNAEWNTALATVLQRAHDVLHISVNDPATTYPANSFRGVRFSMHEDDAGNFLALALVFIASLWALLTRSPSRSQWLNYLALLAVCTLLFLLVLKWQPWHSRLQTPLFILAAPLVGAMFVTVVGERLTIVFAFALLFAGLPYLAWNSPRPLLGDSNIFRVDRTAQYFANSPSLEEPYRLAAQYLQARNCRQVGMQLGGNDWEYPLWVLLGAHAGAGDFRLEHVNVINASRLAETVLSPFHPCAIFAYRNGDAEIDYHGVTFKKRDSWQDVSVYEPVN